MVRVFPIQVIAIMMAVLCPKHVLAANIAPLVGHFGFRAITPPSDAVDFTLPDLDGREHALSDATGTWILLTFFATWCGPCKQEMPSLERLYQQWGKDKPVRVLGVAIESNVAKVKQFTKKLGVTFPVLMDIQGQAATLYRANSIPISYLISPQGQIVGVARGGRDWTRTVSLFEQLLAAMPNDQNAQGSYTSANQPVALPTNLVPPTATVDVSVPNVYPGQPFEIAVHITWTGTLRDYLLLPPHVGLSDEVTHLGTRATTSSSKGRAVVTYHIQLQTAQPGTLSLDPVELRYIPQFETQPVIRRVAGPTLTVAYGGLRRWVPLWGQVVSGVLGLVLIALIVLKSRNRRNGTSGMQPADANALVHHYDAARHARIKGDFTTCLKHLLAIDGLFGDTSRGDLVTLEETARYGGQEPDAQQIDALLRVVERRVLTIEKRKHNSQSSSIKLA